MKGIVIICFLVIFLCEAYPRQYESFPSALLSYRMQRVSGDTLPPDFPHIQTTVSGTTAPGKIFLSNLVFRGTTVSYLMILENSGLPVFYRKMQSVCLDFKVQPNGLLTYFDTGANKFYAMDSQYVVVDSFMTGNGYLPDQHDLLLMPNGHALLMAYDSQKVDMSTVVPGGDSSATVIGLIIQEIDQNKNVVFEWKSWNHFKITDATHEILTAATVDYVHANSIDLDTDGNILLSSRHLDEITKINRQTGAVLWRWGGKNNEFTFVNDTVGFSHQHGARRLANGNILLYDNGNFHIPAYSRAVEYQLDELTKTATLVWEYRNTPDTWGFAMGYAQRLENGNTLIGWGSANPTVTEVQPNGVKVYEMTFDSGMYSYRAFRFPWKESVTGVREDLPYIFSLLQNYPNPFNGATLISFNLNEETAVTLRVYDVLGRLVRTLIDGERKIPGTQRIVFDAASLSSGVYYYRLTSGNVTSGKKMLL